MMVGAAVAPGPAAGEVEHGELITGHEGRDDIGFVGRLGPHGGSAVAGGSDHRPCIMGREELAGQGDVGDVAAIGVDPLVEDDRGAAERKTLSRAGG